MADNEYRTALRGPLLLTVSATGSTVLEVGTRSGIPETSDMDANPYTTSGQTRTAIAKRTATGIDLTTVVGGQKVGLPAWVQDTLTTSMSASAMRVAAVSGQTQITTPFAGSVIGVSGNLSAAITAGTLRIAVSVNGATVFSAVNAATGVRTVYATQAPDTDALAAGDRIGVKLTTSADFAPANNDLTAVVWAEV
jgi:hypothetical protein